MSALRDICDIVALAVFLSGLGLVVIAFGG